MIYYDKNDVKLFCVDINKELNDLPWSSIDLVIADPPYYKVVKDDWDNQWKTLNEYLSWCEQWIIRAQYKMKDSASFYIYGGIGEKSDSIIHLKLRIDKYLYFKDWITWAKSRGMGNRRGWVYTREELLWYVKDNKKFIWNEEHQYGKERRKRDAGKDIIRVSQNGYKAKSLYKRITNVWTDISEQTYDVIRSSNHTTPKPQKLTERIVLAHTKENDTVLDLFCGTGNAAIVCKRLGRKYIGIDNKEEYLKEAIQRLGTIE